MGRRTVEVPTTERVEVAVCDACDMAIEDAVGAAYVPLPLEALEDLEPADAGTLLPFLEFEHQIQLCADCSPRRIREFATGEYRIESSFTKQQEREAVRFTFMWVLGAVLLFAAGMLFAIVL